MTRHRITRTAALGLALAALAAPVAGAQSGQDLRNPDQRDGTQAGVPGQDLRSPDSRDAAAHRGTHNAPQVTVVRLRADSEPAAGGMDWADAGIGAGAAVALVLLGVGGVAAAGRRRHATVSG